MENLINQILDQLVQSTTPVLPLVKNRANIEQIYKCALFRIAAEFKYYALPEVSVALKGMRSGRAFIDLLWMTQEGMPAIAFEVDGTIKPRDIRKLKTFESQAKVFVLYSDRPGRIKTKLIQSEALWTGLAGAYLICPRLSPPLFCNIQDAYKHL